MSGHGLSEAKERIEDRAKEYAGRVSVPKRQCLRSGIQHLLKILTSK